METMVSVKEMLKYAQQNNLKLLSNFSAVFWQNYIANSTKYDKIFSRLYSSFCYFQQTDFDTVQDVTTDFIDAVEGHLLLNKKKYEELYRVNVVLDDDYSLLDNYNITETLDKTETMNKGMRTDTSSKALGQQVVNTENDVSPYDSENFYNDNKSTNTIGSRSDTGSFISGSQSDDKSETYTLNKKGNIGIISGSDMIKKHLNLWSEYEFYAFIFGEISKELLALG